MTDEILQSEVAAAEAAPLPDAAPAAEAAPEIPLEEKLKAQLDEANDKYLRMLAETEN